MEDSELKPPYIDAALIAYLDALYVDRCPEPTLTDREVWIQRGAVGVVRHLKVLLEDQLEKELGRT